MRLEEHLTRDQRPFLHPESLQILQIHSFFSSVHLTHFLQGSGQEDWNGQQKLAFVLSDPFLRFVFELLSGWKIQNMIHYKISNRVSHLLNFYLLVFDRIHDAMCLNKMSRTSSRNIGPQHQKYSSIFLIQVYLSSKPTVSEKWV